MIVCPPSVAIGLRKARNYCGRTSGGIVRSSFFRPRGYVVENRVQHSIGLTSERVKIERRPVNRPLITGDRGNAFRQQSIEMTETEEEPVLARKPGWLRRWCSQHALRIGAAHP